MTLSIKEVKDEFVRMYEDFVQARGVPRIIGRIMAVFLLEGRELSHKEISNLTGYSISSVSRTLDQMIRMGVVHKHKDVSRKQFVYHVNIDLRELIISAFEVQIRVYEERLKEVDNLTQKVSTLKSKEKGQAEINRLQGMLKNFSKTMKHMQNIYKKIVMELASAP